MALQSTIDFMHAVIAALNEADGPKIISADLTDGSNSNNTNCTIGGTTFEDVRISTATNDLSRSLEIKTMILGDKAYFRL